MGNFGISPDTLALRPRTLIQDRSQRESRAQQALQYERSRQDAADRFSQSMASQEAKRKADFAKTQFLEEQKELREKAKLEQKSIDDKIKTDKEARKWAETQATTGMNNGSITAEQWQEAVDYYYRLKTGQAGQPQPQVQFQPAGAEGGYDLRTEEAALEAEVGRMQQPQYQLKDPYTEMHPTMAGGELGYALGTQEPATPPARELTLDEINQQALSEAVAAKQAKPKAPEIPEAVIKTRFASEYRKKNNQIKKTTRTITQLDKQITSLEKAISNPAFNPNRKALKNNLKVKKTKIETLRGKVSSWDDEKIKIVQDARKESEDKQKKLEEAPLTRPQKKAAEKIARRKRVFISGIKRGRLFNPKTGDWIKDLDKELAYGTAMQNGLNVFDPDIKSAIMGLEGESPYGEAETQEKYTAKQEKDIQDNISEYGKSREEVINAMKLKGFL